MKRIINYIAKYRDGLYGISMLSAILVADSETLVQFKCLLFVITLVAIADITTYISKHQKNDEES